MEYQGKNKSPYYGIWQSSLLLIAVPIIMFFFFKSVLKNNIADSQQLNYASLFFSGAVASLFQLSCVVAGLFKGTFKVVIERMKELFGNLTISFKFAMKHYWENIKAEGIVFWIFFVIMVTTILVMIYGGINYFSFLVSF